MEENVEVPVIPAVVAPEVPAAPVKKVVEYQVTDDNGRPIGNPTHIEYTTETELIERMKTAHTHATRAFHRLKTQKTTFRQDPPAQTGMSDQELLIEAAKIKSDDPAEAAAAIRKITNYEEFEKEREQYRIATKNAQEQAVSLQFMRGHINDFYPCEANSQIIFKYLQDNNLEWTVDNLELAFVAVESQLAPVPGKPVPEPVEEVIPAAVAAAPAQPVENPTPAAPPVSVVTEPVQAPQPSLSLPNVKVVDSARVRGVNTGGVQPGQLSGKQPTQTADTVTIEQIAKWKKSGELRAKMSNPTIRAKIESALTAHNASKTGRTS